MAIPSSLPRFRRGGLRMWLLWRHPVAGTAIPPDSTQVYAALRDAERYRDSLVPGSAEWEGAAAVVSRARSAYERGT